MKRRLAIVLYCALALSLLGITAYSQDQDKEIVAEGRSSLANLDIEKARDRALEDAMRNAVEQGVGVFVSSESITQSYRLIYDKILINSYGYVRERRIISEGKQGEFYVVRIAAIVKTGSIKNDLQAIGLLMERKQLPRLMVLIKESWQARPEDQGFFSRQSQAEVSVVSAFLKKGFYVLDSTALKDSRGREEALKVIRGDSKAASMLGQLAGSDIVVAGESISQNRGTVANSSFVSVSTTFNLKVFNVDTAEILAAKTWNGPGAGLDELSASNASVTNVSNKVCDELIVDVLNKWVAQTGGTQIIQIIVYQVTSFSDLDYLEKSLSNWIPGIKELYRRSYESGIAILDARVKGESDTIASAIQKKVFGRFKVIVSGFSKNMIKLMIVKEEKHE